MFRILETRELGRGVKQFVIEAARIARKQKPGQFVIVRLHAHGERIPLTIADSDPHEGTITLERAQTQVPNEIEGLVPFHAGETLPWRLVG